MRKLIMCFAGAMMALSLAACSPTEVQETEPKVVAGKTAGPEGLTPEMVEATKEVVEKVGQVGAPTYEMAFIYYGNADADGLIRETVDVEELSGQVILDQLIAYGVLDEGTELLAFDIEGGEKAGPGVDTSAADSGERTATLDLSQVPEVEGAEETVLLSAIANTYIENFELDQLKLLVNGENYTGDEVTQGDDDYLLFVDKYEKLR